MPPLILQKDEFGKTAWWLRDACNDLADAAEYLCTLRQQGDMGEFMVELSRVVPRLPRLLRNVEQCTDYFEKAATKAFEKGTRKCRKPK